MCIEFNSNIQNDELFSNATILSVKDGLVSFPNLGSLQAGELVYVFNQDNPELYASALVMNLTPALTEALLLEDFPVSEGWFVFESGHLVSVEAGLHLFGTIVDGLGRNVFFEVSDDCVLESDIGMFTHPFLIETRAPNILDRKSVHEPLHSGLKAVDSLIPVGLGQRELIIGDRQTGKTTIGFDLWQNQTNLNHYTTNVYKSGSLCSLSFLKDIVWIIYVAIGQKRSKVMSIYTDALALNMMSYATIVAATAAETAPMQFLSPYTGSVLGEYIRDVVNGHAVLIFDDLSKHAVAYRQMSLLLRRPPGREAFPGDVFYIHSRLLERAAKLSDEYGCGSLTALPIIETQAGDVSAYIPTNVISITDGQIFLETDLFYAGIRPAINAGLSVSRVGSAAQLKAIKQIAGSLKLELAQFREVESFAKLGASLDSTTQSLIMRGNILIEVLKQKQNAPSLITLQLFLLFSGTSGYLDGVDLSDIDYLLHYIELAFIEYGFWMFFERCEVSADLFADISLLDILYRSLLLSGIYFLEDDLNYDT